MLKVDKVPEGLKQIDAENGQFVVALSEMGHNHCGGLRWPVSAGSDLGIGGHINIRLK